MKQSETKVQFSLNTDEEDELIEKKRAKGKEAAYKQFRRQWDEYPKLRKVSDFPSNIDIEVSSSCNLKCDHCFRQYMDIGEQGLMDFDMYKKIVDECAKYNLFTLKFSMRGEPTLHPKIVEMVSYAKKKGIKEVWINTHGANLTKEMIIGLCKAKLDWITVSFDGIGKMYESIRKPLKYENSLNKLKMLRKLRDKYAPDMIMNVQTLWSAIKDNPQKYIKVMRPLVDRVAYNSDMNFKEIMLVPDEKFICPRLWQRIAIASNGDYLKCPSDFKKLEVLGNFKDITIKDAWDVLQGQQRQLHLRGYIRLSRVCRECHHGCKKVKRTVDVGGKNLEGYNYKFREEFKGVGLNREK
ncbi:radical SAM protein [Candidatus Woesearchaeota archaeon]|nr:radical SAM protein [Candidatus Woesearchaeota archaeon]